MNQGRILLAVLLMAIMGIGQEYHLSLEFANRLYLDNKYEEAYEKYNQILAGGFESGEVYYNLGNTAYKLDKRGEAVLFYEKALVYLPGDPDIQYNLNLVKQQVIDRIEMPERPFYLEWYDHLKNLAAKPGNEWYVFFGIILMSLLWSIWIILRKLSTTDESIPVTCEKSSSRKHRRVSA